MTEIESLSKTRNLDLSCQDLPIVISVDYRIPTSQRNEEMSLRDLIFSQQSYVENYSQDPYGITEKHSLSPHLQNEEDEFDPWNQGATPVKTTRKKPKARFSYDNVEYYENILGKDSSDESTDDLNQLGDDERHRRNTKYFGRTPLRTNGGRYYALSPEFTFHKSVNYNSKLLEYMPNNLSFLKFPQIDESFFLFQRKLIQELLLRSFHGRDIDGFTQIMNLLIGTDYLSFTEIEMFFELMRYSTHRIPLITKFGTSLFSKQYFNSISNRRHNSLLQLLVDILVEEITEISPSSSLDYYHLQNDLFGNIRQLLTTNREYPNMKSSFLIWSLDAVVISHQLVNLTHSILFDFNVLSTLSCHELILRPISIAVVVELLSFVAELPYKRFAQQQHQAKIILKDAMNCFHFLYKAKEAVKWVEFQELYIGFLMGRKDHLRVIRVLRELETQHCAINPETGEMSSSPESLRFLTLLLRYMMDYEYPLAANELRRTEVLTFCGNLLLHLLSHGSHWTENALFSISYWAFKKLLSNQLLMKAAVGYIESHPPLGSMFASKSCLVAKILQPLYGSLKLVRQEYSHSPYHSSHYFAWKILANTLGPLPEAQRLRRKDPISRDCEASLLNDDVQIFERLAATEEESDENEVLPGPDFALPKDWIFSYLSGSLLDPFSSTLLPFRFTSFLSLLEQSKETVGPDLSSGFEADLCVVGHREKVHQLYTQFEETAQSRRGLIMQLEESIFQGTSREEMSIGSAFSDGRSTFSQFSQMSQLSQHSILSTQEAFLHSQERRGSMELSSKSLFDEDNRLQLFPRFLTPLPNPPIYCSDGSGDITAQATSPISLEELKVFLEYENHQIDLLSYFTSTEESKAVEERQYSVWKVTYKLPVEHYFQETPHFLKRKDIRCNLSKVTCFLLGDKLLDILCFQAVVASHLISQDSFLPTRVIQLLFEHLEHYSNLLLYLDHSKGETLANVEVDQTALYEFFLSNPYLSSIFLLPLNNEHNNPGMTAKEDVYGGGLSDIAGEEMKLTALEEERFLIASRRNHVIRSLLYLQAAGLNLQRGLFLAFDWGNRFLSDESLLARQFHGPGSSTASASEPSFHHQSESSYYHPHVTILHKE